MANLGATNGGGRSFGGAVDRAPVGRGRQEGGGRRRWFAAILLVGALVLSGISLGTSWWVDNQLDVLPTFDGGTETYTYVLQFFPGTSPQLSCSLSTSSGSSDCGDNFGSLSYSNDGLGSLGAYYIFAQITALLGVVLGSICALFVFMGAGHRLWGRWHFHTTHLLALCAGILLVIAPTTLVLVQPSLLGAATPGSWEARTLEGSEEFCGQNTPNASYWNSCTYSDGSDTYSATWGAGAGWYLAVIAGFCFMIGGGLFLSTRDDPEDGAPGPLGEYPRRRGSPASPYANGAPTTYGAPPAGALYSPTALRPALDYEGMPATRPQNVCSRCGHLNLEGGALCSRCHAPLG